MKILRCFVGVCAARTAIEECLCHESWRNRNWRRLGSWSMWIWWVHFIWLRQRMKNQKNRGLASITIISLLIGQVPCTWISVMCFELMCLLESSITVRNSCVFKNTFSYILCFKKASKFNVLPFALIFCSITLH